MPTFADQLKEAEHLVVVVKANAEDLPGLGEATARLEVLLPQIKEVSVRQATGQWEFQQATRDLEVLKKEANAILVRLRASVKGAYGYQSEKLVQFRLKPLRKRSRTKGPEIPESSEQRAGGVTA